MKETVLYGLPKDAKERYEEVLLLTNATPATIERVKALASKDGFHSFRVAVIDLTIPPDFTKVVRHPQKPIKRNSHAEAKRRESL
jgi:hypothetical protein